ncbi:hypothetical protein [Pseudomonas mediterranea]|uniref:hypothetical protein n=1 Tax=Pseudomonas mediterranea TaxID=183795 RepID=UPI0006D8980D|nr:hypothetical protein [Pseudomonas mediterranea]
MAESFDQTPAEYDTELTGKEGKLALGRKLQTRFTTYKTDRQGTEQVWLTNLRQYLGKYDTDIDQRMPANTSRAYPKKTRSKCTSVESRLMSLLFPASEKNWSIEASPVPNLSTDSLVSALDGWQAAHPDQSPTQADLDKLILDVANSVAELQEKVIDDQLKDIDPYGSSDYEALVRKVVGSGVKYGPGIAKGPMVVAQKTSRYELDTQGVPQVVEVDTYRPYFEWVSCWDYYPDLSAKTFAQMDGEFQRHVYSKQQFEDLARRADFNGDAITEYIRQHSEGNYREVTYETDIRALGGRRGETVPTPKGCKYEVLEYWGSACAKDLKAAGLKIDNEDVAEEDRIGDDDQVRFTAWVVDEVLIKLQRNPFPVGTNIFHKFVFEEDEVNLMGSGLPPIMRDSQLAISSFSRMLIDNASVVCGPNVEVDMNLLDAGQTDMTIAPFKVWKRDGGAQGQRAVQSISFDSHIPELLNAIAQFDKFADSETFVNPATGGDVSGVSGEALRTAGGASMIYSNAALPFKDIVRNFDQFTVSVIAALVQWNRVFHIDKDRLEGDVRPIPRGSTSLMAKEMRSFALDQLATTLTPEERVYIDTKNMLKERLTVRDLNVNQLLLTDDEVAKKQEQLQQQQAQQAQMAAAMGQAQLQNINSDTAKQLSQAQKNLDNADVAVFEALLKAVTDGADPAELNRIADRVSAGRQGTTGQPAPGGA